MCDLCGNEAAQLHRGYCDACQELMFHFAHQLRHKQTAKVRTKQRTTDEAVDLIRRAAAYAGIEGVEIVVSENDSVIGLVTDDVPRRPQQKKVRSTDGFALADLNLNMLMTQVAELDVHIDLQQQLDALNNSVNPEIQVMIDNRDRLNRLIAEKEEYERERTG